MDQLLVSIKLISQLLYWLLYLLGGATKDYELSGLYTVEANATSFSFDVSINDDNVFEGNENFTLTITASWPIKLGEPNQITVNILDDDRECFCFVKNLFPR